MIGFAALALLAAATPAQAQDPLEVRVAPAPVASPTKAEARRLRFTVRWQGGPARVQVRLLGSGRVISLGDSVRPPVTTPPLPPGSVIEVSRGSTRVQARAHATFSPSQALGWAGEGLRGTPIDLAATPDLLALATDSAGVTLWDGQDWRHLDSRVLLDDDSPRAVSFGPAGGLWVAHDTGVIRLGDDGKARRWALPARDEGDLVDLVPTEAGRAWVLWSNGATRLLPDGLHEAAPGDGTWRDCQHLLLTEDGLRAACDTLVDPTTGAPAPSPFPTVDSPTAFVPRPDEGWLVADTDGRLHTLDADRQPVGEPTGPAAGRPWLARTRGGTFWGRGRGLVRVDDHDAVQRVRLSPWAQDPPVHALAPGPVSGKVWVAHDEGVALVDPRGVATPLPVAGAALPPAGAASVAHDRTGALLGDHTGVRWLGAKPPEGFEALQAAVTGPVHDVAHVGRTWLVLAEGVGHGRAHLWTLDRHGVLRRFDTPTPVHPLVLGRGGAAVVSEDGLRAWVPGARSLGPLQPVAGQQVLVASDGRLWTLDAGQISADSTRDSWELPGATRLVAAGRSVLAWAPAKPDGTGGHAPVLLTPGVEAPQPLADVLPQLGEQAPTAVFALAVSHGRLWWWGPEGLFVDAGRGPRRLPLDGRGSGPPERPETPSHLRILPDARGAWVIDGPRVWRVVLPRRRR